MSEEITLLTVYDRLAAIDSKLDAQTARVNERLDSGGRQIADHESRIRSLEKMAWKLIGAFAAVNFIAVLAEWWLWSHK